MATKIYGTSALHLVFGFVRQLFASKNKDAQIFSWLLPKIEYLCLDYYGTFLELHNSHIFWHSIDRNEGDNLLHSLDTILSSNLNIMNNKTLSQFNLKLLYNFNFAKCKSLTKFHKKCDDKGATLTIIKNNNGYIFGGYTSKSWISEPNKNKWKYVDDKHAFLFTIYPHINVFKINPNKSKYAIYHRHNLGPCFGENDLIICGRKTLSKSNGSSYLDMNGIQLAGTISWNIESYEVYSVERYYDVIKSYKNRYGAGIFYQNIYMNNHKNKYTIVGHSDGIIHIHNRLKYEDCIAHRLPLGYHHSFIIDGTNLYALNNYYKQESQLT
eukprot:529067_1